MDIDNRIVREILQLGAYLQKMGNRLLDDSGLNQQQFVVLNEIVSQKKVCQKDLVGKLLIEKSNVSKIIKKLSKAQLIAVEISTVDKRATLLTPTSAGMKVCLTYLDALSKWNQDWLNTLSLEEKKGGLDVLENLGKLIR